MLKDYVSPDIGGWANEKFRFRRKKGKRKMEMIAKTMG